MLMVLADAGGYVDDAAAALQTSSVYISPEVDDAAALTNAIQAEVGDASVGVAVFSDNAALEASGPDIVAQLAQRTDYDTIIVAVGDDLSAGSYVLAEGEAMTIANQAETSAGGLEDALTETVQGIVAASDSPAPAADGGSAGLVIGLAIAAAVVIGGALGLVAVIRR